MSLEVDIAYRAGAFVLEAAFVARGPLTVLFGALQYPLMTRHEARADVSTPSE